MKGLGSKLRIISKSKCLRYCAVTTIVLLLLISLQDKLSSVENEEEKLILRKRAILNTTPQKISSQDPENSQVKIYANSAVKILCYVLLSRARVKTARIIKDTWGSHCDHILFFGGYEYADLPVTYLNVSEGYENLWGKTKAAIIYLAGNSKYKNVQYFLKADDDTFVIVENLRKFIEDASELLNKPAWFGFKLKHKRMPQGYMSGGAGYVFNYEALTRVSKILRKESYSKVSYSDSNDLTGIQNCNVDGEYGVEDLELGKCFLQAGVTSIDTIDENGSERFLPLSYDVLLNGAISSFHWIWNQAWNRIKTGESCCSKELISMHEVSPTQMKTIYYLLYRVKNANK